MSDVTPTPAPKPTGWNALSSNKKIGIVVAAVVIVLAIIGANSGGGNKSNNTGGSTGTTGNSGPSASQQYATWKTTFMPVIQQTEADYTTTVAALNNNDVSGATTDFGTLSQDASQISANATSPDPTLNSDLQSLAQSIQTLSQDGIGVINQTTPLSTFQADITAYENAANVATNQINNDNNSL